MELSCCCWSLDDKLREFFSQPWSQNRRLNAEHQQQLEEERQRPTTLPPIQYIKGTIVVPGDPGVRLLQRIDVKVSPLRSE